MLAIRLPEQLKQRLSGLAEKTGRTKSFYVREALNRLLAKPEFCWSSRKIENSI